MASGGIPQSTVFLPTSRINLTITERNILETSADAIATGEDVGMEGHGGVSQLLLKACPPSYKLAREKLKKATKKFEIGKVYPCPFPRGPPGQKHNVSFNLVLHAIVPSARLVSKQREWTEQMRGLYYQLFQLANSQGRSSLALPLLGSGGAGATVDTAADVLAHALTTFKMKPDSKSSDRHLKHIVLFVRKDAYSKMVSMVDTKLKALPQPNGFLQTAPARPGSGIGKSRPASSSSRNRSSGSARGAGRPAHSICSAPAKKGSSGTKLSKGRTASSVPGMPQNDDDDMSNLALILKDTKLGNTRDTPSLQQEEKEEDMDCDEFDFCDDGSEAGSEEEEEEDTCPICLDAVVSPKKLEKCGHVFCKECIEDSFKHHKPVCPSCNTVYGVIIGNQPKGTMRASRHDQGLPGYENCGQIVIDYEFPSGIQGPEHPNPGQAYRGTGRRAFLPDCAEGRKVYRLLCVAFQNRLTFTVGRSVTTGNNNVVTWNDIHHKTNPFGGATEFGYPDPHYLSRVQEELAAKGVTEECLQGRTFSL